MLGRDELKPAQLGMTRKGKQAGLGTGLLGGSGPVALYGVDCRIACAVIASAGPWRRGWPRQSCVPCCWSPR
jgi:hypothetical protein